MNWDVLGDPSVLFLGGDFSPPIIIFLMPFQCFWGPFRVRLLGGGGLWWGGDVVMGSPPPPLSLFFGGGFPGGEGSLVGMGGGTPKIRGSGTKKWGAWGGILHLGSWDLKTWGFWRGGP